MTVEELLDALDRGAWLRKGKVSFSQGMSWEKVPWEELLKGDKNVEEARADSYDYSDASGNNASPEDYRNQSAARITRAKPTSKG
jgi:hypothetical protein